MVRLRIVRGTVAGGCVVEPGQVLDVPAGEAALLTRLGKAVEVPADTPLADAGEGGQTTQDEEQDEELREEDDASDDADEGDDERAGLRIEHGDPVVTHGDPTPTSGDPAPATGRRGRRAPRGA